MPLESFWLFKTNSFIKKNVEHQKIKVLLENLASMVNCMRPSFWNFGINIALLS